MEEIKIAIFVLDDDKDIVEAVGALLESYGYKNYQLFTDYKELITALNDDVKICIIDYFLKQDKNGLEVIKEIVKTHPQCYFIMLSGQDDKGVIIEYINSIYGGRYIEKGSKEQDYLIQYVGELVNHIVLVYKIYANIARLKTNLEEITNKLNYDDTKLA